MKKIFIPILFLVLFISCHLNPTDVPEPKPDTPANIEENSDLFVETEDSYVFETNDTKYLNKYGYTFWCYRSENTEDFFQPYSATMYKSSGSSSGGYGIVFAKQEIDHKEFLLTVLINNYGQYFVGKLYDGKFTDIISWTSSNVLGTGNSVENTIKVEQKDLNFVLYLNGIEVNTFTVPENLSYKNSKNGFAAVLLNNENFPKIKVKVVYKK